MSNFADPQDRVEIFERHMPYSGLGFCCWCHSPEDEAHEPTCMWVRVRSEYRLEAA